MFETLQLSLFRVAQTFDYTPLPQRAADQGLLEAVMTIVLGILGVVAIIMIIIGGIQYASSQGDPSSTSRAKKTILYALVGLILAIFARVIVALVFGRIA